MEQLFLLSVSINSWTLELKFIYDSIILSSLLLAANCTQNKQTHTWYTNKIRFKIDKTTKKYKITNEFRSHSEENKNQQLNPFFFRIIKIRN